ncbi:MAG: polysaccharide deacetylase family protein [Actinomycetia bacterium]|nr:polysaccharide deacetylase family protein [Actinomycetes bacterium]
MVMGPSRTLAAVGAATRLVTGRGAAAGGVVLAYHDVGPAGSASGWSVGVDLLEAHLGVLRSVGLQIVDLDVLVSRLLAGEPVNHLAAVSFDDALIGVHDHALAVLVAREVPATVFVVSGGHGQPPAWWSGARRTMTTTEIGRVRDAGVAIGAHTRSHPSLPGLSCEALSEEVAGCRAELRELTGSTVDLLAYPSGHHDARVRRAAGDAGFRAGFTFLNGRITSADDPLRLPRLTMGAHLSPARLRYHLLRTARSWPDHQLDRVGDKDR